MNEEDIPGILKNLINISIKAGNIILNYYKNSDKHIQIKDDNSPLTKADTESDEYIQDQLKKIYKIPVISEENFPEYDIRKKYNEFFLVDPLDGTKEFIDGLGEFTVNIAYINENRPVMGVIYAPAIDELFYAAENFGSYMNDENGIRKLPISESLEGYPIATGSRKHSTELDAKFMNMNNIKKIVPAGSSLKFCRVAMGGAHLYPRFQGSMEWDIAAGHIIAKEAGCRIVDLYTMKEPIYNKESLKNNNFIVLKNGIDFSSLKIPENV